MEAGRVARWPFLSPPTVQGGLSCPFTAARLKIQLVVAPSLVALPSLFSFRFLFCSFCLVI